MKLGRLNHIGVATPSIADSITFYRDVMGATKIHTPFDLEEQGVKVCFVDTPGADGAMNGTQIELIEPLGENSTLAGFLAKNPLGDSITCASRCPTSPRRAPTSRRSASASSAPRASARTAPLSFRPSQGHGRHAYRDHGDAEGRHPLVELILNRSG